MVRFFAVAGSSCSALRSLVVFLTMFGGQIYVINSVGKLSYPIISDCGHKTAK